MKKKFVEKSFQEVFGQPFPEGVKKVVVFMSTENERYEKWWFQNEEGSENSCPENIAKKGLLFKEAGYEFERDDKVLVRDDGCSWQKRYFDRYEDGKFLCFVNGSTSWVGLHTSTWEQCIPYEGNEHLCQ